MGPRSLCKHNRSVFGNGKQWSTEKAAAIQIHYYTWSINTQYTVYSLPSVVPAIGDVLLENLAYVKSSYLPCVTQMDSTVTSHNKYYDRLDAENLARFIFHTFHFHSLFSVFTHSQFGLSHCGLLQRGYRHKHLTQSTEQMNWLWNSSVEFLNCCSSVVKVESACAGHRLCLEHLCFVNTR